MKKFELSLLFGLILSIIIGSFSAFAITCNEIRGDVLRLHILANSDSEEDQALKLRVRDKILEETGNLFSTAQDKNDAKMITRAECDRIRTVALEEIKKSGYDYDVKVDLVNMYFNTREYDDVTMPAGYYDAIRIEIGAAKGKNWWCVMFPPMCVPAASEKEELKEVLSDSEMKIVTEKKQYEAKFAVVEVFESIGDYFSKRFK